MNYDSSLYARNLDHAKGEQYFEDLSTLMDVLAQYDGSKAVVLFSPVLARADVQATWFACSVQKVSGFSNDCWNSDL